MLLRSVVRSFAQTQTGQTMLNMKSVAIFFLLAFQLVHSKSMPLDFTVFWDYCQTWDNYAVKGITSATVRCGPILTDVETVHATELVRLTGPFANTYEIQLCSTDFVNFGKAVFVVRESQFDLALCLTIQLAELIEKVKSKNGTDIVNGRQKDPTGGRSFVIGKEEKNEDSSRSWISLLPLSENGNYKLYDKPLFA